MALVHQIQSIPSIWTRGMSVVVAPHSPVRHQSELWNKSSKYLLSSADSEDEHSNSGISPSSLADIAAAASVPDAN